MSIQALNAHLLSFVIVHLEYSELWDTWSGSDHDKEYNGSLGYQVLLSRLSF